MLDQVVMLGTRTSSRALFFLLIPAFTLLCSAAFADTLKLMTDFNVFTLGNATITNANVGGRVAVGGDARLTNFAIGTASGGNSGVALSADATRLDLIVDGRATLTYGSVQRGSAQAESATQIGIGYNTAGAGLTIAPSPLDFDAIGAAALLDSAAFGSTAANGTITNQYSTLTLWGGNAAMNVFTLTAADVRNISSLQLLVPAGSAVIINVVGSSFSLSNLGMSINGSQNGALGSQVLWNFADARSVTLSSVNWLGSILAPFAALQFTNGQVNGAVFVNSLLASGQFNNVTLAGSFSDRADTVPVPEPSTLAFFALGGTLLGAARLLRRQ